MNLFKDSIKEYRNYYLEVMYGESAEKGTWLGGYA